MDADYFLTVANQTMWVLALAAAPILIPALLVGPDPRHDPGRDLDQRADADASCPS